MNRPVVLAAVAATALLATGVAEAAQVHWSIGVNLPPVSTVVSNGPGWTSGRDYYAPPRAVYRQPRSYYAPPPVYVEPEPVYYAPQPRYVEPAPVYYAPQPRYVEPAPVYYAPQPSYRAPVVVSPSIVIESRRDRHRHWLPPLPPLPRPPWARHDMHPHPIDFRR